MTQEDVKFSLLILLPLIIAGIGFIYLGSKIMFNQKIRTWAAKWWWGFLDKKDAERQARFFTAPLLIGMGIMTLWTVLAIVLSQFNIFIF